MATAKDQAEYNALFNAIDVSTSINWHAHTYDVALASITYKASNQRATTIIDPALDMFYLDSGTSVYICNIEADFFPLWPTTPHAVNGVGGSSILAVGIGSIKLTIVKGLHLTLRDVLFIPSATVHLISVSALCAQTRCSVHFDDNTCWVTAHNSTCILNGALSACRLYSLTGGRLSVEHALLIHHPPTLHTWHSCLGHANYCAVYDLAHEGQATGMPIDLSISSGSCADCILSKQKHSSVPQIRQGTRASRKLGIIHVDLLEHPEHVSALGNNMSSTLLTTSPPTAGPYRCQPSRMHTRHSWTGSMPMN